MAFFFPSITIPFRHPSQIIRTRITARTFENLPSPGSIFLDLTAIFSTTNFSTSRSLHYVWRLELVKLFCDVWTMRILKIPNTYSLENDRKLEKDLRVRLSQLRVGK